MLFSPLGNSRHTGLRPSRAGLPEVPPTAGTPARAAGETSRRELDGAHRDISPVDNDALRVDDVTAQSFFFTHPVDGISAGSGGAKAQSLCLVLNSIPSRRTATAACMHKLSTGLCTERLDVARGSQ